jgi:hypothetical protein
MRVVMTINNLSKRLRCSFYNLNSPILTFRQRKTKCRLHFYKNNQKSQSRENLIADRDPCRHSAVKQKQIFRAFADSLWRRHFAYVSTFSTFSYLQPGKGRPNRNHWQSSPQSEPVSGRARPKSRPLLSKIRLLLRAFGDAVRSQIFVNLFWL